MSLSVMKKEGEMMSQELTFREIMGEIGARPVARAPYERWSAVIDSTAADRLLAINDPYQRPISRSTVARYARDMTGGAWQPFVDPLMIAAGDWTLLDGQHRLAAIKMSGTSQSMEVVVRPRESIAAADQRHKRSIAATDSAIHHRKPLSAQVQAAVEMAAFGMPDDPRRRSASRVDRSRARERFSDRALEFCASLDAKRRIGFPASAMAVAIQAYEKHPAEAELFFRAVSTNTHHIHGRPWAILQHICTSLARGGAAGQAEARERYVRVVSAWNAYVTNRDTTHTKYSADREIPAVL